MKRVKLKLVVMVVRATSEACGTFSLVAFVGSAGLRGQFVRKDGCYLPLALILFSA